MRKFLIKLLGGYTQEDLDRSDRVKDVLLSYKESEVKLLTERMQFFESERNEYKEQLFREHGLVKTPEIEIKNEVAFEPISHSQLPWSQRRRALEIEDKRRALREDARTQVEKVRSYWENKNEKS